MIQRSLCRSALLTAVSVLILTSLPLAAADGPMTPLRLRSPLQPGALAGTTAPQCTDGITYDDGTVENGLSFSDTPVLDLVMRFDVGRPNAKVEQVCVCWTRTPGAADLAFDLVFYADDGPGNQPGTFLGSVNNAQALGIPEFPGATLYDYDLSSQNISSPTDNVFVGVSWNPDADPNIFLCTDENGGGNQPIFASGDLGGTWFDLSSDPETSTVRSLVLRADFETEPADPRLPPQSPGEGFDTGDTSPCVPNAKTLCLSNDRFQVTADWADNQGGSGTGDKVQLTPDTGYFWFFDQTNVEMVIKVLDVCFPPFNRFWVFAGGLTDVEVEIVVRDTENGLARRYHNPLKTPFQPIQDTSAFATCP